MKVVNLTGRELQLEDEHGRAVIIEPHGRARVVSRPHFLDYAIIRGLSIPRVIQAERKILDLPGEEVNTIYVVSGVVADAAQRNDVWAVGNKIVYDGKVEAGLALVRYTGNRAH